MNCNTKLSSNNVLNVKISQDSQSSPLHHSHYTILRDLKVGIKTEARVGQGCCDLNCIQSSSVGDPLTRTRAEGTTYQQVTM